MTMADVMALFGTLLALGIAFPGMLLAWHLLFPATIARAQERLEATPWRCLFFGGATALPLALLLLILLNLPPAPLKLLGLFLTLSTLLLASLGAAGLAAKMGRPFGSGASALLRGALALELAAIFPFLGWFLVIPLALLASWGAALFALLRWEAVSSPQPDAPLVRAQP